MDAETMQHFGITDEQVTQVLRDALALLRRDGWCQHLSMDEDGRRCARRAIRDALPGLHSGLALAALQRMTAATGIASLIEFNDRPGRIFEQVEQAFLEAIHA